MRIRELRDPQRFQDLCQQLFEAEYGDVEIVDDSAGDEGVDAYVEDKKRLFAVYCPEKVPVATKYYQRKIRSDLKKAAALRDAGRPIDRWVFLTPAPLNLEMQRYLHTKAKAHKLRGVAWSERHLLGLLAKHPEVRSLFPDLVLPDIEATIKEGIEELRARVDAIGIGREQLDEAKRKLEERVRRHYEFRLAEARSLLDRKLVERAERAARDTLTELKRERDIVEPSFLFRAYTTIAGCHVLKGEAAKAATVYEEAHGYQPEEPSAVANLALAALLRDQHADALRIIDRVLDDDPDHELAVRIKANVLRYSSPSELDDFLAEHADEETASQIRSAELMRAGAFAAAAAELDKLIDAGCQNEEVLESAAAALLSDAAGRLKPVAPEIPPSEEHRRVGERVVDLLTRAIDLRRKQELVHPLVADLSNRAFGLMLLGRASEAIDDCRAALELRPTDSVVLSNKANAEALARRWADAARTWERYDAVTAHRGDKLIDQLYCYDGCGELTNAATVAERLFADPISREVLEALPTAVEVYDKLLRTDDADALLHRAENAFPNHTFVALAHATRLEMLGEPEAETWFRRAAEWADAQTARVARLGLATHLFDTGRYEDALVEYEASGAAGPHLWERRHLTALYRLRRYRETLALAATLRGEKPLDVFASPIEAATFAALGELAKAADIYFRLSHTYPAVLSYLVNYGLCLSRLGEREKALRAFDQVRARLDSSNDLVALAERYRAEGRTPSAVAAARKAYDLDPHNPDIHLAFMRSMLMGSGGDDGLRDQDKDLLAKILAAFNSRFPEDGRIKMIDLGTDLSQLRDAVSDGTSGRRILDFYRSSSLPISVLPKVFKRRPFEVFAGLAETPEYGLRVDSGDVAERERETAAAAAGKPVVADLLVLYLLGRAGALDVARAGARRVLVHQAVLDELFETLADLRHKREAGGGYFSRYGDQLIHHELDRAGLDVQIALVEQLVAFVRGECEIVGLIDYADLSADAILAHLEDATALSAELARQRGVTLLSDDASLRHVLRDLNGMQSFGGLALVEAGRRAGLVSEDRLRSILDAYAEANGRVLPISGDLLWDCVIRDGFRGGASFERTLRAASTPEVTVESLAVAAAVFLKHVWLSSLPAFAKSALLGAVLEAGTRAHGQARFVQAFFEALSSALSLLPIQSRDLKLRSLAWCRARSEQE
jgi:tetratricopeptide (TPR) repeat protein